MPSVLWSNFREEVVMLKDILRCATAMVTTQSCCAELIPEYPQKAPFDLNHLAGEGETPHPGEWNTPCGRVAGGFGRPADGSELRMPLLPKHPQAA